MEYERIARYAFAAIVIIAVVMGLVVGYMVWNGNSITNVDPDVTLVLLILGIIVGLVTITVKEVTPFLIAAIALVVAGATSLAGTAGVWGPLYTIHPLLYYWATAILRYITTSVAPAAVIIAVRAIFAMERQKQ
jgi:hypothetical protein